MDRKDKDMDYYHDYINTGNKKSFQRLWRGMRGYLNDSINKSAMGSNIPKAVFEVEAAQQMQDAVHRFRPGMGKQLQGFVRDAVEQKLKRVNAKYQNMGRITERKQGGVFQIKQFNNEKLFLRDKLNREPSAQELSKVLGWSVKEVENLSLEVRKDLSLNNELEDIGSFDDYSAGHAELSMHYYDMDPEEQVVYEHISGTGGKQALLKKNGVDADWSAIAKETGLSENKVQKIRKRLMRRVGEY